MPEQKGLGCQDGKLRGVGRHHIGGRRSAHEQLHQGALHPHCRETEQTRGDFQRRTSDVEWRPGNPSNEKSCEQRGFQYQTGRKCREPPLVRKRDEERSRCPGKEKDRNGECYEDESVLAPRHLCSGSNEASSHLSDKQTKQTQKRATVDVSRNKAQEQRGGSCIWVCSILLLSHGVAFEQKRGKRGLRTPYRAGVYG
jgi:hypothetical protein